MHKIKLFFGAVALLIGAFSADCSAGELSGIGGDGNRYTASWTGSGTLRPTSVYAQYFGEPFIHFTLDNAPWPNSEWGIAQNSWSVTCANGGELSGIGGDENRYTASWTGSGTLRPTSVYAQYFGEPFIHFTLDNAPWPNSEWGIAQNSWSVTCAEIEEVSFDIKPQSCPNVLNIESKGLLSAVIAGSQDLDVTKVDPVSIRLLGVAPTRSSIEDVTAPHLPFLASACSNSGPDGLKDLTIKFDTQEIIHAIESSLGRAVNDGEVVTLSLTGNLKEEFGHTPIHGEDFVTILNKGKK